MFQDHPRVQAARVMPSWRGSLENPQISKRASSAKHESVRRSRTQLTKPRGQGTLQDSAHLVSGSFVTYGRRLRTKNVDDNDRIVPVALVSASTSIADSLLRASSSGINRANSTE